MGRSYGKLSFRLLRIFAASAHRWQKADYIDIDIDINNIDMDIDIDIDINIDIDMDMDMGMGMGMGMGIDIDTDRALDFIYLSPKRDIYITSHLLSR